MTKTALIQIKFYWRFCTFRALLYFLLFQLSIPFFGYAQADKTEKAKTVDLTETIIEMDSILFDAFNRRDVKKFKTLFTEDLEFFHDKDGLVSYQQLIESLETLSTQNNDLKRELVLESLEVYEIKGYGAMQIGRHTFCHTENGKNDCGTFKFVHIWQNKNGNWKISRVISYDH